MSPAGDKTRVLIVDDDPETRIFLCRLLEGEGCEPIQAADGEEGLRRAFAEAPDVIILDLMISREGVIQMYAELKDDEDLRHIPVIMLSEIDEKIFNHYRLLRTSADGRGLARPEAYLEKPPEKNELLWLVRYLAGSRDVNRA